MLHRIPGLVKGLVPSVALTLLLTACNLPSGPQVTQPDESDAAAAQETIQAAQTATAQTAPQATNTPPPPTMTPTAAATSTPSNSPTPSPCTNRANFAADVTVPDGTSFSQGESFVKTWRLENAGTCTWTTQYELVFHGGDQMGAVSSKALPRTVVPNDTIELSVNLQAPSQDGSYRGLWMLRSADGQKFGIGAQAATAFWVEIQVGPVVHTTAQLTIAVDTHLDLDAGSTGGDSDLLYEQVSATEYYLAPQGSATVTNWGGSVPSFDDCTNASKSGDRIQLGAEFNEGDFICFETNDGRIGRMVIDAISGATPPELSLDIRTWDN